MMEIGRSLDRLLGVGTHVSLSHSTNTNGANSSRNTRLHTSGMENDMSNSPSHHRNRIAPVSRENGGGDGGTSNHSNHGGNERVDSTPRPDAGGRSDGPKKLWICYLLAIPPHGLFGAYNYYMGRRKMAIIYSCTLGLCIIGWIVDLIRMRSLVQRSNEHIREKKFDPYCVDDAYLAWFPLGLLGVHRFYLGDWVIGVVFFMTLSAFSFGWWFDACFLRALVEMSQRERDSQLAAERAARGESNAGYQDDEYAPPPYHTLVGLVTQRMNSTGSRAPPPPVVPEILVASADGALSDTDTASTPSYPVSFRNYDLNPERQRRRSSTSSRRSSTSSRRASEATSMGLEDLGSDSHADEVPGSRRSSRSGRVRTDSYVSSVLDSYSDGTHSMMDQLDVDPAEKPPEYSSLTNIPSYVEPAPPAYDSLYVPDTVVHM